MVENDLFFAHSYEVEEIGEFPSSGKFNVPQLFFPVPKDRPEHNGLWLRVNPANGRGWIGIFAFGPSRAFSRVVSTPDPDRVCIVSQGAAYIVKADQPEVWEQIPVAPVLDVRSIPESELLVFSDFVHLAAYGRNGLAWQSPRVCWDDLKIGRITGESIEGTGYDPTNAITHESRFAVDLKTGRSLLPAPVSREGKPIW
jgi:hypothetical protein